eukprot:9736066-Alexandrium_andersonii.AAC.1
MGTGGRVTNAATGIVWPGHGVKMDGSPVACAGKRKWGESSGGAGRRGAADVGAEEGAPVPAALPDEADAENGVLDDGRRGAPAGGRRGERLGVRERRPADGAVA